MKKLQIILMIALTCLFVSCKEEDNKPTRIKSPYINRFLGEYDITERYVMDKENFVDDSIYIDTLVDTTYSYKLKIEESIYECFDICLTDDQSYFFTPSVYATISDDSTFFFSQQVSAEPFYLYTNGKGTVNYIYPNTTTIKMNYIKSGANQYGEQHHFSITGTRYK